MKRAYSLLITDKRYSKIDKITDIVADYFSLEKEQFIAKNRQLEINEPRQIAMYLCRMETPFSLKSIANYFNRDHATALHASRKIADLITIDPNLKQTINEISRKIAHNIATPIEDVIDIHKIKHTFYLPKNKTIICYGFDNEDIKNFKNLNSII